MKKNRVAIISFTAILLLLISMVILVKNKQNNENKNILLIEHFGNSPIGATMPEMLYVDNDKVIMYDYPGLVVYNLHKKIITGIIDFHKYNITLQGDKATIIKVTPNGKYVTLDNGKEKYLYYTLYNKFKKVDSFQVKHTEQFEISENNALQEIKGRIENSNSMLIISPIIKIKNQEYVYLYMNIQTNTFRDVYIGIWSDSSKKSIPVFGYKDEVYLPG